jgi:hypothetical protein
MTSNPDNWVGLPNILRRHRINSTSKSKYVLGQKQVLIDQTSFPAFPTEEAAVYSSKGCIYHLANQTLKLV